MFVDLVGSTEIARRVDIEDLGDVNRAYQVAATQAIARYGGTVAKDMGDGILAYFGYPIAHENDAERAVHAGLAIVDAVRAMEIKDTAGSTLTPATNHAWKAMLQFLTELFQLLQGVRLLRH